MCGHVAYRPVDHLPGDEERGSGRRLSRRQGCRSLPLAGRRQLARRPQPGSRPRTRSRSRISRRSRSAQQIQARVKAAQQLREVLLAVATRARTTSSARTPDSQNQSVLYIQKGLDGHAGGPDRSQQVAGDGTTRLGCVRAVGGRASTPSTASRRTAPTGRHTRSWSWRRRRRCPTRSTGSKSPASRGRATASTTAATPRRPRARTGRHQRRPSRLLPQGRHAAVGRIARSTRTPANPQRFNTVDTTDDERFALLTVSDRGKGKDGNALFARDLSRGEREFNPVVKDIGNESFGVVDNVGDKLLVETNRDAPNGRVVLVDPQQARRSELEDDPARAAGAAREREHGGREALRDLPEGRHDARLRLRPGRHARERDRAARAAAPPAASAATATTRSCSTRSTRSTCRRRSTATTSRRRRARSSASRRFPGYNPDAYETEAVFYPSKDGTKIPMFLVHKKGLKLDGTNPTLLYGYGGFNIVQSPTFSAARLALLEQGVRLRQRQPARRRRVRRGVARAGHEAEEAERVRRLHRRGANG